MLQGGGPSIDDNDILDALDLKRKRCVRKWTPEEDQEMIDMVLKHGTKMWGLIGSKLKDRTGKQCRERWHNQLDPAIKKDPWTRAEEEVLMRSHSVHGNKWAEIAKMLPGRTDNAIKNHWNSAKRRLSRQLNMTVSTAERRSWSYDEDDPSKAPQGGSGPGGGKSRYAAHADITVDTGASYPASDDDDEADNDADDGSEDRTSSPTSVADFSSVDGGTGNIFSAKEDGGGRGGGRSEQQAGVLSLKTQGHSAAGCSSTSGSGGEAGRPLYRTGGGCGQAGSEQTPAATPGGSGGGGGVGHEGDARTTSELMSAQALFRGSIPGLTSFDRVEINNFHREKAMLLSAAKAAGDTKKRIMIEETTPDVLNAKGLLMFLKQSPSVVPDPAATSTRTRRGAGAIDSDGRSPAAGVGTNVYCGDAASADTGVSDVGAPIETAALQALKMPPPLPLAGAAEAHVAEASAPAPAGVAASSKSKASPLLAAAAAMDRGRPVSATAAAAARSAAAAAAAKAARFKTCLRGGRAPCDATVAARRDLPRRVSAAAAELLRAPSSEAEPTPRGGCDGSSLPGRTPAISPARSLSPVKIALPATRCGIRKLTGGPVPVTPGTPAASPASTTKAHLAAPSARMPVCRMPVVPSHPLTPRTPAAAHPPSTPVGRVEAASPAKIPASTPSSQASYVSRASHSRPALPPPARAIPVTPGTPCFARGPVELFASPLPGPLARGGAEDATAAATAMARLAASAAPTERRGGGNVMGKRKESGEAVVAKRGGCSASGRR